MRTRIIPEIIPEVYDYTKIYSTNSDFKRLVETGMRLKYDVFSDYVAGPLIEADYYAPVELDKLNLFPGQYRVEFSYGVRTGFGVRRANPELYTLNLEKDSLQILPTNPFDLPIEYGAVYTFENTNESSWESFFDGKLVNSINEPVPYKKLDLFLEINDKYEKVATVETDADGNFYHHHKIYGWVEERMLAKIEYRDDDILYKILVHEEYAGMEEPIDGNWFFFDLDGDNYPDWNYSLMDLLGLYMSGTLGYSMPIQPDDFTFATGNFYGPYGDLEFSDLSASTLQPVIVGKNYKIDVEIEWGIDDDVESMEYLRWDYSTSESPNVDFSVWNYNLQVYEVKTSSPFALTSDYYDSTNNNTVRARIESVLKDTAYELYLDQLRIDYIIGAPPEPLPTLAFMALFDEDQGDTTIDDVNDLVGTLYGNTSWTDGRHNSSLFFDGTGQVTIEEGAPQTNYLTPIQAVSPSGEFTFTYGSFVSTGDIELDDGSETNIRSQKIDNSYHEIEVVVQWGPEGSVDSMDYLHWAHRFEWVATPTTDFQIWNYALNGGAGDWETVSQNPFSLTSDYYDENYNVKVRYYAHADGRKSTIDLFIDQLRLEYTTINEGGDPQYADFDWVDFEDVLDDVLGPGSANDEFVITGWINPSAFTSNQSINGIKNVFFSKENIELGINESGYLQVYMNTDGVETTAYYGTDNSIGTNDWIYFALRYNNSDIDVFLDEVWYYDAVGAVAEPWSGGGSLVNGGSLIIGAELTAYSCFTGRIDDLSVFREAISHFDIEAHKGGLGSLEIIANVSKEDVLGGWEPITTSGDIMDGYLNFEVTSTGREINNTQFYLSDTEPDLQNPTPQDWALISEYSYDSNYYSAMLSSRDIPDYASWYFIARVNDSDSNVLYDAWEISETIAYFEINHFSDSINFTYLDTDNKISHYSQIGVIPFNEFEDKITQMKVFVNYSGDIDYLTNVSYYDLYSNYWLIYLNELSSWKSNNGLSDGEYAINFIVEGNFSFYGFSDENYYFNYTLDSITYDCLGPTMSLVSTSFLEATYDDTQNSVIDIEVTSPDNDFSHVKLYYQYQGPNQQSWNYYGTFDANDSIAQVPFNLINLRDDNISIQILGFDSVLNSKVLYESTYWIVKDMNNHMSFNVEGIEHDILYGLEENKSIKLDAKIQPFDNDITRVVIGTNYETFNLLTPTSEIDRIYFEDDIYLNSTYYGVFGADFVYIPINVKLYQDDVLISSKEIVITVIENTFEDQVQISNITITTDPQNNYFMSFTPGLNAYNNSHSIPYIVSGQFPVVKLYNPDGILIQTISLRANNDTYGVETYNTGTIEIKNNRFTVPLPIPASGELCSIGVVNVNGVIYPFTYFINNDELLITLSTEQSVDGIYGATGGDITITYGVSLSNFLENQFIGTFDLQTLPQDNYTIIGEFYELLGDVIAYQALEVLSVDYQGPIMFKQFGDESYVDAYINPEGGSISFVITDFSGILSYDFNATINGYWVISGDLYTFYFDDVSIAEGLTDIELNCSDVNGYWNVLKFTLFIDKTPPSFIPVINNLETLNALYSVNVEIFDASTSYELYLTCINIVSGITYSNLEYTLIETGGNTWQFLMDTAQLPDGIYDVCITVIDRAENINQYTLEDRYFDNSPPEIENILDIVNVNNDITYNTTLSDLAYFNDVKNITVAATDIVFDDFNWGSVSTALGTQNGVDSIFLFFTNPLSTQRLVIESQLNFEKLTYKIIGFGNETVNYDTSLIKAIQSITIGGYSVDRFVILIEENDLILQIDELYRYLLSSSKTDEIYAEFYQAETTGVPLVFDTEKLIWKLENFNISSYLNISDGQQFLFWFEIKDGMHTATAGERDANTIISRKYRGIYDNLIQKNGGSLYEWSLGTDTQENGIIVFGTEDYLDSTIQFNGALIQERISGESDIDKIFIYGTDWEFVGRAYYSGEDKLWNYYWNYDLLGSIPPQNYMLNAFFFDKAGNFINESISIKIYDFADIELITNLLFGEIFEFDANKQVNIQQITGTIANYTGQTNLWEIIAEYYNPTEKIWIPLQTDAAAIDAGDYSIIWDIKIRGIWTIFIISPTNIYPFRLHLLRALRCGVLGAYLRLMANGNRSY